MNPPWGDFQPKMAARKPLDAEVEPGRLAVVACLANDDTIGGLKGQPIATIDDL